MLTGDVTAPIFSGNSFRHHSSFFVSFELPRIRAIVISPHQIRDTYTKLQLKSLAAGKITKYLISDVQTAAGLLFHSTRSVLKNSIFNGEGFRVFEESQ